MKKFLSYILILVVLMEFLSPITNIYAANETPPQDPTGVCVLRAQLDGTITRLSGETEFHCHSMADDPANKADFVGWTEGTSLDPNYQLLGKIKCPDNTPGCTAGEDFATIDTTQDKPLGGYLDLMIKVFIGICAVLAVVMVVIGGLEYMTSELISSKEHGKERIRNAIVGLFLAIGAWTLLYQINPDLLNTDLSSLTSITVGVDLNADVPQTPVNGQYTHNSSNYASGSAWAPGALANLSTSGATVYNSQCTTVGQTNCTSTAGLDPSYLNTIRQKCPSCVLSIQGGTEFWAHGGASGSTSHGPGSPTVDLGLNTALTNYIKSGTHENTPSGNRWTKDGISYLYEPATNHWHAGP